MIQIKHGCLRNILLVIGFLAMLQGCMPGIFPGADVESKEPNNDFADAQAIDADALRTVEIAGAFSPQNDIDVFLLGDLTEGETISVQLRSSSALFNSNLAVAIFDENFDVAYAVDFTPSIMLEEVLTHSVRKSGQYYLAIFQSESDSQNYSVQITLDSGTVPATRPQTVFLNFNTSGNLNIGGTSFRNLQPFSSINLPINYPDVAADITQRVRNDFLNLDISIVSSYEASAPAEPHSTVYITGSTGNYFGLADQIDWYNEDPSDNAVVFAGLLAADTTSISRFPQLVANVVTHETGHLLGLIHTDDNTELMDISTPTFMLEMDQNFHRASLAPEEFPIGWEDTLELLTFTLGIL